MTVFTKDPRSPEVLAAMKKDGQVLLEVTFKCLYVLREEPGEALPGMMKDWFVYWNGRSHAYRDSCHMGGGDEVQQVINLTDDGSGVLSPGDIARTKGDIAGYAAFSKGGFKPDNPYRNTDLAEYWEKGYGEGFTRCGHDKQAAFEREAGDMEQYNG
jgi:hypothetical protein